MTDIEDRKWLHKCAQLEWEPFENGLMLEENQPCPSCGELPPAAADEADTDPLWSDLFDEVRRDVAFRRESYRILLKPDEIVPNGRWYYQIEHDRPDTFTGVMGVGRGGKAYLSPHMTRGELCQVLLGLFLRYDEHEVREDFRYQGKQIFGPHMDPIALMEVADRQQYRG